MSSDLLTDIAIGFVIVWGALAALHSFVMAASPKHEPAPPEEPEHHH